MRRCSRSLSEQGLFLGSTILTAFNDNALITYLATLVPNLSDPLKYAVVEGAVVGGGLTVIANAPNPAGQALLSRFFGGSLSPLGLFVRRTSAHDHCGAGFSVVRVVLVPRRDVQRRSSV